MSSSSSSNGEETFGAASVQQEAASTIEVAADSPHHHGLPSDGQLGDAATAPTERQDHGDPARPNKATGDDKDVDVDVDMEPPSTPLSFKLSRSLYRAARVADASGAGSKDSFWSHTMYERVQACGAVDKVKVHYCTSQHTMEHVCQKHFLGQPVLGFDLEWYPYATAQSGPRANVSLIQLASPDRIGLFHLALFPLHGSGSNNTDKREDDLLCPTFRRIMADPQVSKVGVQILGDCTRLRKYLDAQTRGIVELSHLYKQVRQHTHAKTTTSKVMPRRISKVPVALAVQVQDVLGLPLYKGATVRSSDWARRLNHQQLTCMYILGFWQLVLNQLTHHHLLFFQPCFFACLGGILVLRSVFHV